MIEQKTYRFQSEVKQLLHLMIHSLYSNKEIFLRELISNAADAADKLRFLALSNPDLYEGCDELHVRISFDKTNRILTIADNGIGMNRDEVINNLGTIARSGTKNFLESIAYSDKNKCNQLIGQFGVGFYSAFIVANKVSVRTRLAGDSVQNGVLWESQGEGEYTVSNIIKDDHGTEIILHLRESEDNLLNDWYIKSIVSKYSDHINLPVEIEKKEEKDNKKIVNWEKINKAQALWIRSKFEIKDEEYKEFYKYITHDSADPLIWSHNHVEGKQEYISLLYIPSQAPWNIWDRNYKYGLKLYVQRVFIMDDAEYFIPHYLRFVRGIIDSNNLSLNISREIIQKSAIANNLRSLLTKRILQILENLSKNNIEKYQNFWKQFSTVLKEGLAEDPSNQKIITKLLRFSSTYNDSSVQTVTLIDYVSRMKENQKKIYYLVTYSHAAAKGSPYLELLRKNDIEVLLLSDHIDEWMMNYLVEFNGKSFQSVTKNDEFIDKLIVDKTEKIKKESQVELELFIKRAKNTLGDTVKEVRLTNRLIDTPAIINVSDTEEMNNKMARLFAASSNQNIPKIKYILELNSTHPIVKHLINIKNEDQFKDWMVLLLEQAILAENGTLEDPNTFIKLVNKLLIN